MKISELIEQGIETGSLSDLTRALMHLAPAVRWGELAALLARRPDLERNLKVHVRAVEILLDAGPSLAASLDLMRQWRPDGDYFCLSVSFKTPGRDYEPCVMMVIRGEDIQATVRRRGPDALYMNAHFYHEEHEGEDKGA